MIVEIKYTRRINKGDYNSEEYTVGYAVNETECPAKAMQNLKLFVEDAHNGKLTVKEEDIKEVAAEITKENGEVRDSEMVNIDHGEEPKKAEPKKKKTTKKKVVKKAEPTNIKYDRNKEEHKKLFASVVTKEFPGWLKDNDLRSKAATTSKALEGSDMLRPDGSVMDEFVELVVESMDDGSKSI